MSEKSQFQDRLLSLGLGRVSEAAALASARLLGTATLRPGVILTLKGFGERFSGNYWLTSVVHTYDREGFTTDFEGSRTAT